VVNVRPVVGVVSKYVSPERICTGVNNEVRQALLDSGALPIGLLPPKARPTLTSVYNAERLQLRPCEMEILEEQLALCRGIILQGGQRTADYEYTLAKLAYERNIPTLGICHGQTTMAQILGMRVGRINEALHKRPEVPYAHEISVSVGSQFYDIVQKESLMVNSRHMWAVTDCAGCACEVGAWAPDGTIEVFGMPDKTFYMGMRFHPESLYHENPAMERIFQAFVQAL